MPTGLPRGQNPLGDARYTRRCPIADRGRSHASPGRRAITNAVRLAAEHGDHFTADHFTAGLAELRTEIAALDAKLSTQIANVETRLIKWMVGTVITTAALTFAILRFVAL